MTGFIKTLFKICAWCVPNPENISCSWSASGIHVPHKIVWCRSGKNVLFSCVLNQDETNNPTERCQVDDEVSGKCEKR